ncbi:hypothetical protein [uncultured Legionella sp.]|uniref:hypothetical protein n=1 Tax=uncultured Legionella sp. TaxID=210934 RepID=UPI002636A62F|nr:hypothetical protein [uncultured Legionella sp.]
MKEIILTVVFEGTIFSIEEANTHLHHVLYHDCEGIRIRTANDLALLPAATHLKMGFNGCGVDFGVSGLLFGSGLETQFSQVEEVVKQLIRDGNKVKLNAIGLSRGGVASILLAKQLGDIDQFHLETNLLLLDPVPGNMLITSLLDYFHFTLANQAMDLSHSKNLKFVEALYPYLEVGDDSGDMIDQLLAKLHIPIRPTYPAHCEIREEVILGAHLNAFQDLSTIDQQAHALHGVDFIPIVRQLSKEIINDFLKKVNALSKTEIEDYTPIIFSRFIEEQEKWIEWLQRIITDIIPKNRPLHSLDDSRLSASNNGLFLNKTHRELLARTDENPDHLCLKIIPERPRVQHAYIPLSHDKLRMFIFVILDNMTEISRQNKKGQLLQKLHATLREDKEFTQEEFSFILRDILAVALQRGQNDYSWFKRTTTIEDAIIIALNGDNFPAIKQCINPDSSAIIYSDLNKYVLGRNDLNAFDAVQQDINLDELEHNEPGQDRYRFLIR